MKDKDEKEKYIIFYAPDPDNPSKFIVIGRHPVKENYLSENKCSYCRTIFFGTSNCPNCGGPRID